MPKPTAGRGASPAPRAAPSAPFVEGDRSAPVARKAHRVGPVPERPVTQMLKAQLYLPGIFSKLERGA